MTANNPLLPYTAQYIALSPAEDQQLLQHIEPASFKKGEFLLEAGQRCNRQYFITQGCTRTYYVDKGAEEHIIQFGIENWWAADLHSFINHTPADYHIQALESTEVLILKQEVLEELYLKIPQLERLFRIIIQNAYVAAQQRIVATISQTAEERYTAFLQKYPGLSQRVPQYMIASYIGVTPEFFSKMKKEFYR